ncbi:MAG: hypothetical protein JWO03_4128 [Bacteroidetes bacterium]|nr:hypothetical protein [Bacteroidota bacterium]
MKTSFFLFFILLTYSCMAQDDIPDDFFVTMGGDTVYGRYTYTVPFYYKSGETVSKIDRFKTKDGKKISLNRDSISTYSIYLENTNRAKNDPHFYARTWIKIHDSFYELYSGDSLLSIVMGISLRGSGTVGGEVTDYFFNKHGDLTPFNPSSFYSTVQKYFADCPSMLSFIDHVPNKTNPSKTHKAGFNDAELILAKYKLCLK